MPAPSIPHSGFANRRAAIPRTALKELMQIPGIGPSIAADLYLLGIRSPSDLQGHDPQKLYERHMQQVGRHVDRCVLYTLRCAVYYASQKAPDPELLKWWNWKDRTA